MRILGIESSCDETAAAVVEAQFGEQGSTALRFSALSSIVASQVATHAKTGGVVPEVAARAHLEAIIPVIQEALHPLQPSDIDAIAVTAGPGLVTSLRVGVETARLLSYAWKKPLVAVNHLEGHIYANWLDEGKSQRAKVKSEVEFPVLVLIVSGGHTELVLMREHLDYKIIGATRDDAAGEAFDKVAKLLNLAYPGGPAVSKLAETGNAKAIQFPRPMIDADNFDFSFAGLKTAVLYHVRERSKGKGQRSKVADICASFEQAAVDVLVKKTMRAAKKYKVKTVLLGGGVAANLRLRRELEIACQSDHFNYRAPEIKFTGDNATMIAVAGALHALKKDFLPWAKIDVDPQLSL